jgi:hypothetical protein
MSENLLTTLIYGVFSIIVAVISSFATIRSAEITSQTKTRSRKKNGFALITQKFIALIMVFSIIGALFFIGKLATIVSASPSPQYKTIDLGSMIAIKENSFNEDEPIIVYVHHPASNIQYNYVVFFNSELIKVEKSCGMFGSDNITNLFSIDIEVQNFFDQANEDIHAYKSSSTIKVSENCSISFFIQNHMKGFVSISLDAKYVE